MKIIGEPEYVPDNALSPPVKIADGAFMQLPGTGKFRIDVDGAPYVVQVHLAWTGDRVRPDGVVVKAPDDSPPVASTVLHQVAVGELAQQTTRLAFRGWRRKTSDGGEVTELYALTEGEAELVRLRGPVGSSLEQAARIYNFATAAGLDPVQEVTAQTGLQRATATRWIRRAREQGLIT